MRGLQQDYGDAPVEIKNNYTHDEVWFLLLLKNLISWKIERRWRRKEIEKIWRRKLYQTSNDKGW